MAWTPLASLSGWVNEAQELKNLHFLSFPLQIPLTISEALDKYFLGFVYIYKYKEKGYKLVYKA